MTNFATQAYLSYKGLNAYLNWHAYTSGILLRPVLVLAMYFLIGRFATPESAERYIIGLAAYSIPASLHDILNSFHRERAFGTLSVVFTARGSRLSIYWSRCVPLPAQRGDNRLPVPHLRDAFSSTLDLSELDYATLAASVAAITAASTTFVMFVGSFCDRRTREWEQHPDRGSAPCSSLSRGPSFRPRDSFRILWLTVGHILPLTNGLVAFREAFGGAGLAAVAEHLLLELAVGLVYAVLGYFTCSDCWRGRRSDGGPSRPSDTESLQWRNPG